MHWWKNPIEIVLELFGLANAGVEQFIGTGTYLVLFGLLVGKPVGICLFSFFEISIPAGNTRRNDNATYSSDRNYFFDRVYSRVVCLDSSVSCRRRRIGRS